MVCSISSLMWVILKVTKFNDNSLRDRVSLSTWAVNGRLGELDLIYTGSFMKHRATQMPTMLVIQISACICHIMNAIVAFITQRHITAT